MNVENPDKTQGEAPIRGKKRAAAALVTLTCLAGASAVAATATLQIFAKVVRAIDVSATAALDFGTLAVTAAASGRMTLKPTTGEIVLDNNGGLSFAAGVPQAGRVRLKSIGDMPVDVSVAQKTVTLTNGTATLQVRDFNFQTDNGGPSATIVPELTASSVTFPVGATLVSKPQQVTGTYVGSNVIFANYQ